eukprot:5801638-Amphidinium_carterae.1
MIANPRSYLLQNQDRKQHKTQANHTAWRLLHLITSDLAADKTICHRDLGPIRQAVWLLVAHMTKDLALIFGRGGGRGGDQQRSLHANNCAGLIVKATLV